MGVLSKISADAIKAIAGLLALTFGLITLAAIALVAIGLAHSDTTTVTSIASGSFGVIGSIVGAYFGVKIGTDGTAKAVESMKDEATKAQAFAAHMDPAKASAAFADYQTLRTTQPEPTPPPKPEAPPAGAGAPTPA